MKKMYLAKSNNDALFIADDTKNNWEINQLAKEFINQENQINYHNIDIIEISSIEQIPESWKDPESGLYGDDKEFINPVTYFEKYYSQEYQHYLQLKKKFEND